MNNNRRALLKSALSVIVARGVCSLAPLRLLLAPRTGSAQYVDTAVTVISALNALSAKRNGNGEALRLAAIDLKLDEVLRNQVRLATAIDEVQRSIGRLQAQIPGFITAEAYRVLWEDAYGIFDQFKNLNQRPVKIDRKVADYLRLFNTLYDSVTVVRSRIATTHAGAQGVASMLSASQALILYVDCLKAMAAFERALPRSERWNDDREQKMKEVTKTLIGALDELQQKRIPEAVADQTEIAANTLSNMKPLWKGLWDQMIAVASQSPQLPNHALDRCFKSDYLRVKVIKSTRLHYVHLDYTLTYTSHIVANKVAAVSEVTLTEKPELASMGLKRHWEDSKGMWVGIKDRAAYEEFAKHWPHNRGPALKIWNAVNPASAETCTFYPQPIPRYPGGERFGVDPMDAWGKAYFAGAFIDAAHFGSLCDEHAQAMLYLEVLRKCQGIGKQLTQECLLFSKSVEESYEEDTSLWVRIRGLFK